MPLRIDPDDLLLALDTHSPEIENYLDLQSGEVIPFFDAGFRPGDPEYVDPEALEDATRYRLIEPVSSRQGWLWMREFAEGVAELPVREGLLGAIEGGGAFGRFKDALLSHPEVRDAWFRFQHERLLEYGREWLVDEGIDAELAEVDRTGQTAPRG